MTASQLEAEDAEGGVAADPALEDTTAALDLDADIDDGLGDDNGVLDFDKGA